MTLVDVLLASISITLISCLYISVLFTTPVELSSKLIFSFQIFSVFVVMTYLFYVLGMAVKLRKQGAIALMFGYGMLSFAGVNDILYARELGGIGYLMGFGVIVYVLSQLFVTNMRLTAAFGLSEQLGVDLEASNKNLIDLAAKLETTVTERTAELTASNQKLEEMARTDALTGLINRRGVELAIKQEHERFKRSGVAYSVAIIDLDHFKSVNDRFGHGVGDDVLVATASCLASTVRSQDMVVRWGGEEFVIVFPDTDLKGALVVLENIRKAIKESVIQHDQGSLSVTATIGIAEVEPEESFGMCLNRADELLYQGKEDGRDRIVS